MLLRVILHIFGFFIVLNTQANEELTLSQNDGKQIINFRLYDEVFHTTLPAHIDQLGKCSRFLYAYSNEDKKLFLFNREELKLVDINTRGIAPYLELSLKTLVTQIPLSIKLDQHNNIGRFSWTTPSNQKGFVTLNEAYFNIQAESSAHNQLSFAADESFFSNELNVKHTPLALIKPKQQLIRGNGEFLLIENSDKTGHVLLSFDPSHELIHRYEFKANQTPTLTRSYSINYLSKNTDMKLIDWKLSQNFNQNGHFAIHNQKQKYTLSLSKLEEHFEINRLFFLTRFKNEVLGNSWSKSFWFLGLFNSLIDSLDDLWDNPQNLLPAATVPQEVLNLANDLRDNDVLDWIDTTPLLLDDERATLRYHFIHEKGNGYKWFVLSAAIGIMLQKTKLVGHVSERSQVLRHFRQMIKRPIYKLKLNSPRARSLFNSADKLTLRVKKRIIRNIQNSRFPQHLVESLDSHMRRSVKKYNQSPEANGKQIALSKSAPKTYVDQAKEVIKYWDKIPKQFTQKYADDYDKLLVYAQKSDLESKIRKIKAQVLIYYRKSGKTFYRDGTPVKSIKDNRALGYINATDKDYIIHVAKEVLLKGKFKGASSKQMLQQLKLHLDDLDKVNATIRSWPFKKDVAMGYELIRVLSEWYARYLIPETVYRFNPKRFPQYHSFMSFVDNNLRKDRITLPNGRVEKIVVTGADAERAFKIMLTDQVIDTTTMWYARKDMADSEKVWGNTNNHISMINGYGMHIDLFASRCVSVFAWILGMPVSFAQFNMNFGTKGEISLLNRLANSTVRKIINLPWTNLTLVWPAWSAAKNWADVSYRTRHKDHFDETEYQDFLATLESRTTNLGSFFEREFFRNTVGIVYQHPQYSIQSEFYKFSSLMFKNTKFTSWIERIVIPATSGLFFHKWWSNYFAENNILMEDIIRNFHLEGYLTKLKKNPNLEFAHLTEKEQMHVFEFFQLLSLMKREKTHPLPLESSEEQISNWYADFISDNFLNDQSSYSDLDFSEEIVTLSKRINKMKSLFSVIPGMKKAAKLIRKESPQQLSSSKLLEDFTDLQGQITNILTIKTQNKETMENLQDISWTLNTLDVLIMADILFNRKNLPEKIKAGTRKFSNNLKGLLARRFYIKFKSFNDEVPIKRIRRMAAPEHPIHKFIDKYATRLAFVSIPLYLLTKDQRGAHLEIHRELNETLLRLQTLLFEMSREVIYEHLRDNPLMLVGNQTSLKNARDNLSDLRQRIENALEQTYQMHQQLRTNRSERLPKIWNELAPITMGVSLSWMAARHTLFRLSKGMITKMTDTYAPLFFKTALISWPYTLESVSRIEENLTISTYDFFSLINSYEMICASVAYFDYVLENGTLENTEEIIDNLTKDNQFLERMRRYRDKVLFIATDIGLNLDEAKGESND